MAELVSELYRASPWVYSILTVVAISLSSLLFGGAASWIFHLLTGGDGV
jgi:hypothetical protein